MSEPCISENLFVQFEKCMCTIQKVPFSGLPKSDVLLLIWSID